MKLKVAIVGYGLSGKFFHASLIRELKELEVVAVVSSRVDEVVNDFPRAVSCSLEAAIEMSDIVVIATPHELHYEQAKLALEAGKHVVVEKPFTTTIKQAKELYRIANNKKIVLAIFYNRRFDADFLTIKKLIGNNSLGDIISIESHFDRFRPIPKKDAWREKKGPQSGIWWDLGPHLIDQALQLFGVPNDIDADIGMQRDGQADDYFNVTFKYNGGKRIRLHASCIVRDFGFRFRVHGTKGSALFKELDVQESQLRAGVSVGHEIFGIYPENAAAFSKGCGVEVEKGNYLAFYKELIKSIKMKEPSFITEEDVLFTMNLLLDKSLAT